MTSMTKSQPNVTRPYFSARRYVFGTLLVLSLTVTSVSSSRAANLVVNSGFETGAAALGSRPTTFGEWRGDRVSYTTTENGIAPPEGSRMLRFINTEFIPNTTDTAQYWQNIDLSSFGTEIASGNARLSASVLVNRVQVDAQTDTLFGLHLHIRSGDPSAFTNLFSTQALLLSDSDLDSWQLISLMNVVLPTNTTYVMVELQAFENVFNDTLNPELDGHYADGVTLSLSVVPEPSTLAMAATLLLIGLAVVSRRRADLKTWLRQRRRCAWRTWTPRRSTCMAEIDSSDQELEDGR